MPTTSNFGWTTPADTDLVKDGAAAIRTLGNGIDTSLVDLKGGTTGQVLAKASNTDLDFTWTADASGIPATIFDAKGDIIAATAADTASRLAVGANNTVLTADSTTATGLKWATPSASNDNYVLLNTGGTSPSGVNTVTISFTAKNRLFIYASDLSAGAGEGFRMRFNSDSNFNYRSAGITYTAGSAAVNGGNRALGTQNTITLANQGTAGGDAVYFIVSVEGAGETGQKPFRSVGMADASTGNSYLWDGFYFGSSAITSVTIYTNGASNFDAGTIYVYGA